MTDFQKAAKRVLAESSNVCPQRVVCKRNGMVEAKRGYFYRHGNTADSWANRVMGALGAAGLDVRLVEARDDFRPWPGDSYFTVVVEEG